MIRPRLGKFIRPVLFLAAVQASLFHIGLCRIWAADSADSAPGATAADVVSASLRSLLMGSPPRTASDLRAMQSHLQQLAEKVKKSTVGVEVRRAWGSGVIISPDG